MIDPNVISIRAENIEIENFSFQIQRNKIVTLVAISFTSSALFRYRIRAASFNEIFR